MKKIILPLILLGVASMLNAQPGKTVPKTIPKTVPKTVPKTTNILKTNSDSVSYVLGEVAAFGLLQKGLGEIKMNNTVFMQAVSDILAKKKPLLEDATANTVLSACMEKQQSEKIKPNIEEGRKFLAQNKLKPGVKTTASGLQYEIIREGTGIKPTAVDTFVVNYRGTLLNGTEFDASYNRNEPLQMPVNKVITGWTEGLQLMPVGSKYKFYIPYELGYGAMGSGQIPGGATLIFEIELLDVKKQ